jgi:hypothetical protein
MRTSTIVLTCVSVTGAVTSLALGLRLHSETGKIDALNAELQAQRHLIRSLPVQSDVATQSTIAPPPQSVGSVTPPPRIAAQVEAGPDMAPPGLRARDFNETRRQLLGDPEYRNALQTQQRTMMEERYRDLPKALGLSPEKASQLFDLLADNMMQNFDGRERRPVPQADGSQVFVDQYRNREEAAISKLLGAEGARKFREYNESMMSRSEVRQLGAELIGSSDPLREDQMQPLFDVVYAEQKRLQQEWSDLSSSGISGSKMSAKRSEAAIAANDRIVDAASSLLTGAQLAALREMYRRQKAQMEAQDEMNRLTTEAMLKTTPGRTD